jgi:hypothetical protein
MFAAMTTTLRQAVSHAQQQARQLNQEFVGTEHLVLGVLQTDGCEAVRALLRQNLDPQRLHRALLAQLRRGKEPPVISGDLPFSAKAQGIFNSRCGNRPFPRGCCCWPCWRNRIRWWPKCCAAAAPMATPYRLN